MRFLTLLSVVLFLICSCALHAQSFSCGMDILWQERLLRDTGFRKRLDAVEKQRSDALDAGLAQADGLAATYALPVVVHIVHQNDAENISDAQVLAGIQQINDAFANSGYYDKGDGVPTPFQFCLALRTPDGAPTTGINRVVSTLTMETMEYDDESLKDLSRWDPLKYINIWVVREIISAGSGPGVAGYAYLPGAHGDDIDGIVMEARWFGASPAKTGVLIHEMGHYLGLLHTFQGGCTNDNCNTDGDRVCDTPPDQSTAWQPCAAIQNSCTTDTNSGFVADQNDMTINYMDYATVDCYNAFTKGQSDRMEFFLNTARKSLLASDGCLNPCANPIAATFTASAGPVVPVGTTVDFINGSVNGDIYQWLLNGIPVASTAQFSNLMATLGAVVVTLNITNADSTCADSFSDTLTVICPLTAGFNISTTTPKAGETIALTATNSNAAQWEWTVNGIGIGSAATAAVQMPYPGIYSICLTESNDYCAQTRCQPVEIDDTSACKGSLFLSLPDSTGLEEIVKLPDGSWLAGGASHAGDSSLLFHLSPNWNINGSRIFDIIPGEKESIQTLEWVSGAYVVGFGASGYTTPSANRRLFIFKYHYPSRTLAWVRRYRSNAFQPWIEWSKLAELPADGNYLLASADEKNAYRGLRLIIDKNTGDILSAPYLKGQIALVSPYDMKRISDQIYVSGRYISSATDQGAHLVIYSGNGQIQSSRYYTNSFFQLYASSITHLGNALYILADGAGNNTYAVVLKTDLAGQVIWSKRINLPVNTSMVDGKMIIAVNDGVIIHINHPAVLHSFLYKFDTAGNLVWSKILNLPGNCYLNNIYADGNKIAGIGYVFGGKAFLFRIDPEKLIDGPCTYLEGTAATAFDISVTPTNGPVQLTDQGWTSLSVPVEEYPTALELSEICPPSPCPETCDNGLDDDGDGYVDCFDTADCPCQSEIPDCYTADTLGLGFSGRLAWKSDPLNVNAISTPIAANLNPGADSIPEIIVLQGEPGTNNDLSSAFLIFRGDGANAAAPDILAIPGSVLNRPANFPVVGDVDGDGSPELIVVCADRYIRVFAHYQAGGSPPMALWLSSADPVSDHAHRPFLADFDQNGKPEVYVGTEVFQFDFSNAALNRVSGPNQTPSGKLNTTVTTKFSCNPVAADLLTPVDCGGDPDCAGLEIAAGPVIYSVDLNPLDGDPVEIKPQRNLNAVTGGAYSDGYTTVADIDLDGIPDVLVAGRQGNQLGVYAWNKTGLLRFFNYPGFTTRGGGIVAVANVWNDKASGGAQDFPELLAAAENRLVCFNLNRANQTPATPWWWEGSTADLSGSLGISTFDFNNDGWPEILLRDQNGLRVLYGGRAPFPTGVAPDRNWMAFPMGSGTIDEYPVVADLDHDGQAEITITGHEMPGVPPAGAATGRLWVFESDPLTGSPWLSARSFWNQYSYFIVPVNDDLSIPKTQQPHHLELPGIGSGKRPFNRFLSQLPLLNTSYDPYLPLPDAVVTAGPLRCSNDSICIPLTICNRGSAALPAGTPLRLYRGDPTAISATLILLQAALSRPIPADSCLEIEIRFPTAWDNMVFVVVNDNGSLPTPFSLSADFPSSGVVECNYANNIDSFPLPAALPPIDLGPDVQVCQNGVWTFHASNNFATYKWSTLSTDSMITVYAPGTYWVEARDQCGQVYTDTVVVSVSQATIIDLGPDTSFCGGGALQFDVPGFEQYQWVPETGLSCAACPNPAATVANSITYTVLAKTAHGCYSVDSIRITVAGLAAASLDTALCANTSLTWNGVEIPAGSSHVFTFSLQNGCDSTFTVHSSALPTQQTQESRSICAGDSTLIFNQWRSAAGVYAQTFSAQNGCDSTPLALQAVQRRRAPLNQWRRRRACTPKP
ncbi:MAG: hypothetical protein IPH12_17235 [Saprospirales bacterium]|nr:hypothetical protein [Saprospirales bacterium]